MSDSHWAPGGGTQEASGPSPGGPTRPQGDSVDRKGIHRAPGGLTGPQGTHWTSGGLTRPQRDSLDPRGTRWTPGGPTGPQGDSEGPRGTHIHHSLFLQQFEGLIYRMLEGRSSSWFRFTLNQPSCYGGTALYTSLLF